MTAPCARHPSPDDQPEDQAPDDHSTAVRLLGVPPQLRRSAAEHYDGTVRELQLVVLERVAGVERRSSELAEQVTSLDRWLRTASPSAADADPAPGHAGADQRAARPGVGGRHVIHLPPGGAVGMRRLRGALAAVDVHCGDGDLLMLPRSDGLRRFSDWWFDEVQRQSEGARPTPWSHERSGRPQRVR